MATHQEMFNESVSRHQKKAQNMIHGTRGDVSTSPVKNIPKQAAKYNGNKTNNDNRLPVAIQAASKRAQGMKTRSK